MLPLLQELAREACTFPLHAKTHWNNPRWNADAPPFNLIQVEMPRESGIPVDFLPILDYARYRPPAAAENINTLGELACSFLGFSSIVRRHIAAAPIRATILENIPRLPMKMFIYRRSKGARDEQKYLIGHPDIDMDEGWPRPNHDLPSDAHFADHLAAYLWEAKTRFGKDKPEEEHPDQICHFSCHSETKLKEPSSHYTIKLGQGGALGNRTVDLMSLTNAISRARSQNYSDRKQRPLVFLNSCGSANLDPTAATSFPELFLQNGFTGFIGTEAVVPEDYAAAFAQEFYANMLSQELLGKAMLATRWNLLKAYNNPMGLIYSAFAEPEISVRRPLPRRSQPEATKTGLARFFANTRRALHI